MKTPIALTALVALSGCIAGHDMPPSNSAATRADHQPAILQPAPAEPVTQSADGTCWAREVTPAVYEHVMGEVQVVQAEIAEDGSVLRPPVYRRAPVPRIVRPRAEIRFEAPCPAALTPDFIATLQRALAARGYFAGNVTGRLDAPTTAAVHKYQSERGLQSGQVSLETARALGLVAVSPLPG